MHTTAHGEASCRLHLKLKPVYQSEPESPIQAQISGVLSPYTAAVWKVRTILTMPWSMSKSPSAVARKEWLSPLPEWFWLPPIRCSLPVNFGILLTSAKSICLNIWRDNSMPKQLSRLPVSLKSRDYLLLSSDWIRYDLAKQSVCKDVFVRPFSTSLDRYSLSHYRLL